VRIPRQHPPRKVQTKRLKAKQMSQPKKDSLSLHCKERTE